MRSRTEPCGAELGNRRISARIPSGADKANQTLECEARVGCVISCLVSENETVNWHFVLASHSRPAQHTDTKRPSRASRIPQRGGLVEHARKTAARVTRLTLLDPCSFQAGLSKSFLEPISAKLSLTSFLRELGCCGRHDESSRGHHPAARRPARRACGRPAYRELPVLCICRPLRLLFAAHLGAACALRMGLMVILLDPPPLPSCVTLPMTACPPSLTFTRST